VRVAIYAGHGGNDPGAVSGDLQEKDFTLAISMATTVILRRWGYMVLNNRTADVPRIITQDANLANTHRAAVAVEIHLNSNKGTPGTGCEAFVSLRNLPRARTLAGAILGRIAAMGFRSRGIKTHKNSRGKDTFGILRLTNMPTVLLECAFINNPADMARLDVDAMARAIAESVREVFPLVRDNE